MRVLVCGSRNWTDKERIRKALASVYEADGRRGLHIIDGAAQGADSLAYAIRKEEGYSGERYPADWKRYGKRAGYIRNQQMLDEGTPDIVLAFWDGQSRGTKMMIELAKKARISVMVISE